MAKSTKRTAGQIVERGPDKWLVRVFLGLDPETKKRKYVSETVEGKKTDARKKLTELQGKVDTGKVVIAKKMTVGAFLDYWLEQAGVSLARQSRDSYEQIARVYIKPTLGSVELGKLDTLGIQSWVTSLTTSGLSPRTVQYSYAVLRTAMGKAKKWKLLPKGNPCEDVELPARQRVEAIEARAIVAPEDVQTFLAAAEKAKYGTMMVFGICTGARPGEVQGVLWKDLDLDDGTWTVQRSLTRHRRNTGGRGEGWELVDPKTVQGVRTIALPASLVTMLRTHKAKQAEDRLAAGPLWQNHGLVFTSAFGSPLFRQNISTALKKLLASAGLSEKVSRYGLRHSLGTNMAAQGQHPRVMAQQLGHADPAFTLKTYTQAVPSMMKLAAATIEDAFFGEGPRQGAARTSQA